MRIKLRDASEVAHVWASRSQPEGRCANMFFDGAALYSYGRHFQLARFDDKNSIVLLSTRDYSATTAKHKRLAASAVSHLERVYVHDSADLGRSAEVALQDIERARVAAVKARSTADDKRRALEGFIERTAAWVKVYSKEVSANVRREVYGWDRRRKAGTLFKPAEVAAIKARLAAENEEARKRRAEREAAAAKTKEEREAKARETLRAWAAGESDERPYVTYGDALSTALRIKEGRVETSRGAQITIKRAAALWALLCAGRDVSGVSLDNYAVTSWDGAALRVGCHIIERGELERMAAALKLSGALPPAAPARLPWRFACCGRGTAVKNIECPEHGGLVEPFAP